MLHLYLRHPRVLNIVPILHLVWATLHVHLKNLRLPYISMHVHIIISYIYVEIKPLRHKHKSNILLILPLPVDGGYCNLSVCVCHTNFAIEYSRTALLIHVLHHVLLGQLACSLIDHSYDILYPYLQDT